MVNTRIAIFFTNYGPYHLARVEAFKSLVPEEWEVFGLEISRDGVDYQWKTDLENSELQIS